MATIPLYKHLARTLLALQNCEESGNKEWADNHRATLEAANAHFLPSGAGFDAGSTLSLGESTPNRLVINTSYHHTNEDGYYDGWTNHKVIVKASLAFGLDVSCIGPNRNGIHDHIAETFKLCLTDRLIPQD